MRATSKAFYIWLLLECGYLVSLLLPHDQVTVPAFLAYSMQSLAFVLCIFIARNEPVKKNRFIFVNFSLFFAVSILFHMYQFVGKIFPNEPFAKMYFNQYISYGGYFLLLAFALVYLTVDVLFRDFRTVYKYFLALSIAGGFFWYYYQPLLEDPKFMYHTADVKNYKELSLSRDSFKEKYGTEPTLDQLIASTQLSVWRDGKQIGQLYPDESEARIRALYPYLEGDHNYLILVWRPVYVNVIKMSVVCVGFILLFFGYLYMKDPPQGAYIEKIMFLFLVLSSLEILHAFSAITSLEFQVFAQLWNAGQYVSVAVIVLISLALATRLHFITSIKGEFYESELATRPAGVTRWRDTLDNIVIEKFFNRKLILGRMFVDPTHRAQ
jgi:hypothetical protein